MTPLLENIFGELGISQYLDAFVDQGFDSWETILDITESDLDALGVKLGHRRKLQRRIANSRGLAPDASLVSPTQLSVEEPKLVDGQRPEAPKPEPRESNNVVITKRKYRRHPKADENAPERPPSAYVLFSNKMREDLKGRNLTFTEIAKLVGEYWQNLTQSEKEPFERRAQAAKDKYNADLAEYKKTPLYNKYMAYLQEFKAKHSMQSQDKDASKRVKLSESGGVSSGIANATPNGTSRSGSASESGHLGSEPPPSRQQRISSTVSMTDSQYSASMTPGSYHASLDDSIHSPGANSLDRCSQERSPTFSASPRDLPSLPSRRNSSWIDEQRSDQTGIQRHLPSLSDVFDGQRIDASGFSFPRNHLSSSPGPGPPPGLTSDGRPPTLKKEQSSTGSTSSASSYSYPRTPVDGSLPIHALLASKPSSYSSETAAQPHYFSQGAPSPIEHKPSFMHQSPTGVPLSMTNGMLPTCAASYFEGAHTHYTNEGYQMGPPIPQPPTPTLPINSGYGAQTAPPGASPPREVKQEQDAKLDGMSALLKAGEIVDRRAQ